MYPGAGNFDNTIVNALMNYNKDSYQTLEMNSDQV